MFDNSPTQLSAWKHCIVSTAQPPINYLYLRTNQACSSQCSQHGNQLHELSAPCHLHIPIAPAEHSECMWSMHVLGKNCALFYAEFLAAASIFWILCSLGVCRSSGICNGYGTLIAPLPPFLDSVTFWLLWVLQAGGWGSKIPYDHLMKIKISFHKTGQAVWCSSSICNGNGTLISPLSSSFLGSTEPRCSFVLFYVQFR
jgi:hypothetical protein